MDTKFADRELSRPERRPGLWQRVWHWLLDAFRPPPPEPQPVLEPEPLPPRPGRLHERRSLASPLVVPASGFIFDFNVHAAFDWSSTGLYREELVAGIQHFMRYVVRDLRALAAKAARQHPPHHAERFETQLQEIVAEKGARRFWWGDSEITCRSAVWVSLDERVKRAVEPYWEQLIKLDCEHEVQLKKVAYADRLSQHWLAVLTELVGNPLADGAARMTEVELASVVDKIVAERKGASAKLDKLLEDRAGSSDLFAQQEHYELMRARLEAFATSAFAGITHVAPDGGGNGNRRVS